ncbi:MAG: hypothetical protein QHJ82_05415, partial [Verrucomicrobiota bacterium]|nr:hypothetical protein [Verrucomicrobiota bacterium]
TSATADRNKGRFARHLTIRGQNPNYEPVTLFASLSDVRGWQATRAESIHSPAHWFAKGQSGCWAATF